MQEGQGTQEYSTAQNVQVAAKAAGSKAPLIALIVVCLAGAIACAIYLAFLVSEAPGRAADRAAVAALQEAQAVNSDVKLWLQVPSTSIDCAVSQSVADANFYQSHDASGAVVSGGSAYLSKWNNAQLTDAVTVISGDDTTVFSGLHSYSNADFLEKSSTFSVYQGDRKLTYNVVCAYASGPDELLSSYGYFKTYAQLDKFIEDMLTPATGKVIAADAAVSRDSRIIVLCTNKTGSLAAGHFCVCAVQVQEDIVQ